MGKSEIGRVDELLEVGDDRIHLVLLGGPHDCCEPVDYLLEALFVPGIDGLDDDRDGIAMTTAHARPRSEYLASFCSAL